MDDRSEERIVNNLTRMPLSHSPLPTLIFVSIGDLLLRGHQEFRLGNGHSDLC